MLTIVLPYAGALPVVDGTAYVAPGVMMVGDITIGPDASVWFGSVLRADTGAIHIGARSNVQDGTILHVNHKHRGVIIGDDVTVGHQCLLHACTLEDGSFVGMRACVMDDVVVEKGAMVAAGSLVTKGKRVGAGQLWAGSPAKYLRDLTDEEKERMTIPVKHYAVVAKEYLKAQRDSAIPSWNADPRMVAGFAAFSPRPDTFPAEADTTDGLVDQQFLAVHAGHDTADPSLHGYRQRGTAERAKPRVH